jgi:hypothetical protein
MDMEHSVPRIGAWAGVITVIGIVGYHVALMILAGQRVSGTTDLAAITAFYGQSVVGVLGVSQFLVVIAFLVFAVALHATITHASISGTPVVRLFAGVALAAAVAEVPVVLTETAAQAALVTAVQQGESVGGLFRFWDALYNSGLYGLEATWVLAFGLAIRRLPAFPRVMVWLSLITGAMLGINVFAIWVGIPDAATLPSAVAIAAWLVGASYGLRRLAAPPLREPALAPSA